MNSNPKDCFGHQKLNRILVNLTAIFMCIILKLTVLIEIQTMTCKTLHIVNRVCRFKWHILIKQHSEVMHYQ